MAETHGIEVKVCDRPEEIYEGADIVAGLHRFRRAGARRHAHRKGRACHQYRRLRRAGRCETLTRIDVYLRFGDAPAPTSNPALQFDDEHLGWEARPQSAKHGDGRSSRKRGHGVLLPDKRIALADLIQGKVKGRTSRDQITYSERGNLQGAQFFAVAGRVYELAKAGFGPRNPDRMVPADDPELIATAQFLLYI